MNVVGAALRFAEVNPEDEQPSEAWMSRFDDPNEARRAFTTAKLAWLPSGKAPVAIEMSSRIMLGIHVAKQRRKEQHAPVTVNIENVQMPDAGITFEQPVVINAKS